MKTDMAQALYGKGRGLQGDGEGRKESKDDWIPLTLPSAVDYT